jgi:hypothetical protein
MKRFITFGDIGQYRNVVKTIQTNAKFGGLDDNGEPIILENVKLPTLKVTASEKIHGTNASVCYSNPDGIWFQSRKNIITPDTDNAGCAFAANSISNKSRSRNHIYMARNHSRREMDM